MLAGKATGGGGDGGTWQVWKLVLDLAKCGTKRALLTVLGVQDASLPIDRMKQSSSINNDPKACS